MFIFFLPSSEWTLFSHLYPSHRSILTKISSIALLWNYLHLVCLGAAFQRSPKGSVDSTARLINSFDSAKMKLAGAVREIESRWDIDLIVALLPFIFFLPSTQKLPFEIWPNSYIIERMFVVWDCLTSGVFALNAVQFWCCCLLVLDRILTREAALRISCLGF